jgi:hypothetical protein
LLEYRYLQQENHSALSKWIRNRCGQYTQFEEAMTHLTGFVNQRKLIDDKEMAEYQMQAAVNAQSDVNTQVAYVKGLTIGPKDENELQDEEDMLKEIADVKEECTTSTSPLHIISDAMEYLQEDEEDFLDMTQPSLQALSQSDDVSIPCTDASKDIEYIISCRQCLTELGHRVEASNFVTTQRSIESPYFDDIRPIHIPKGPRIVYELLPDEDWHSDLFRIEPKATHTVTWSTTDRVCYREIHCPTCQSEVPNTLGSTVIGGTIVVCESGSPEETTKLLGRHWLLREAVKIGRRPDHLRDPPSNKPTMASQNAPYIHITH